MEITEIEAMAEDYFDWPTDRREFVTYRSSMLFALYCVQLALEQKANQDQQDLNETLKRHL